MLEHIVHNHDGHSHEAMGATVKGIHVTGYTSCKLIPGPIERYGQLHLTQSCGTTMIGGRGGWIVEEYRLQYGEEGYAIVFPLRNRRYIIGYALGIDGMLFRGELVTDAEEDDARRWAMNYSSMMIETDEQDQLEQDYLAELEAEDNELGESL